MEDSILKAQGTEYLVPLSSITYRFMLSDLFLYHISYFRGRVLPLTVNARDGWKKSYNGKEDPRIASFLGGENYTFYFHFIQ